MNQSTNKNSYSYLQEYLNTNIPASIIIVTDRNTSEMCLPHFNSKMPGLEKYDIIELDPGEENKNIDIVIGIWSMMQDFGLKRNSLVIALGGGVLCDMVAFAASTFKRGVPFVLIPTTLLAQTDAAIGGKTGIDFNSYKNMVGVFSEPVCRITDTDYLDTLPENEWMNGFAEMLKHGLIADKIYFKKISFIANSEIKLLKDFVQRSVEIKEAIVSIDPFEKNERKKLNFGHTIAHALETLFLETNKQLAHGQAVASGIIMECYLSYKISTLSEIEFKQIEKTINLYFKKIKFSEKDLNKLTDFMKSDKKNESDEINFTLLKSFGEAEINRTISVSTIHEALKYYIRQAK